MEMRELTDAERLALVGLAKVVVRADDELSAGEEAALDELAGAVGEEVFLRSVDEAMGRFHSPDAVWEHCETIDRQQARELIFDALCNLALPEGTSLEESATLERLRQLWKIALPAK